MCSSDLLGICTIAHWYAGVAVFLLGALFLLRSRARAVALGLAGALLVGAVLAAPVAWVARSLATAEDNVVGIKTDKEIATVRRTIGPADPVGFFMPGDYRSPDFRELSRYGEEYIHCHYLGWIGILAAFGALARREQIGRAHV